MDCALWLNRKKICSAAEIPENLDVASLRGYFLAGSLIPWLNEHGGARYAKRLAALSHDDPHLNEKIARIFGGAARDSAPYKTLDGVAAADFFGGGAAVGTSSFYGSLSSFNIGNFGNFGSRGSYNYSALTSFGSYLALFSSGKFGSLELQSLLYGFGSGFGLGSGVISSLTSFGFHEWEWEWLWRYLIGSSFTTTSAGSFTFGWEWLWKLLGGSSFFAAATSGISASSGWSGNYGSFALGWAWLWKLLGGSSFAPTGFNWNFGSFDFGSFDFNSFCAANLPLGLDEYDLILLKTLAGCPLDRYGYGIHNI